MCLNVFCDDRNEAKCSVKLKFIFVLHPTKIIDICAETRDLAKEYM